MTCLSFWETADLSPKVLMILLMAARPFSWECGRICLRQSRPDRQRNPSSSILSTSYKLISNSIAFVTMYYNLQSPYLKKASVSIQNNIILFLIRLGQITLTLSVDGTIYYSTFDCKFIFVIKKHIMLRPLNNINDQSASYLDQLCSPRYRKRADSLVFSITSEKGSTRDVNLLNSKQQEVCNQLQTLQLKLCHLENKVQSLPNNHFFHYPELKTEQIESKHQQKHQQNWKESNKQNQNVNKIGKIVKKNQFNASKLTKDVHTNNKAEASVRISRNSIASANTQKSTEIARLKRQFSKIKQSMNKSQHLKSICSERLSASKSQLKDLKRREAKQQRIILQLRAELRKSETIRERQKHVIQKQQLEIAYIKQILRSARFQT